MITAICPHKASFVIVPVFPFSLTSFSCKVKIDLSLSQIMMVQEIGLIDYE